MIKVKKNNFFLNKEVNTFLKNIIKNKSLANGYIFYGAEGLGKKQTALPVSYTHLTLPTIYSV